MLETLGGFIISTLGMLPKSGDEISLDGLKIIVSDSDARGNKQGDYQSRLMNLKAYVTPFIFGLIGIFSFAPYSIKPLIFFFLCIPNKRTYFYK